MLAPGNELERPAERLHAPSPRSIDGWQDYELEKPRQGLAAMPSAPVRVSLRSHDRQMIGGEASDGQI
jgi:hypothetical protein